MSQAAYVCPKCLEEDPTNFSLITHKCEAKSRHDQSLRVQVYWQDDCLHRIRPMPNKEIVGRFILCYFGPQCKNDRCTYAHSEAEQVAWNTEKFGPGSKRKLRTQTSDPNRGSGAPQYNPQRRHTSSEPLSPAFALQPPVAQPQHRAKKPASQGPQVDSHPPGAQVPRTNVRSQGRTQEPGYSYPPSHHHPGQLQPANPQLVPVVGGASLLTPGNYQYTFSELVRSEKESHARILEERCDGQFELVKKYSRYTQSTGHLLGISGDNIAYVTQACDSREGVSISREFHEIKAAISPKNYNHTEDVLYINFDEKAFNKCFPGSHQGSKWKVSVKFLLKVSYFRSLQRFIESLSPEVIRRIMPNPQQFTSFQHCPLDAYYEHLNLKMCSEDQRNALATIISSPPTGPPVLVTGPFGTGKTRILALAALYYLKHSVEMKQQACILVCTQQHTSANAFIEYLQNLLIPIPGEAYIAKVTTIEQERGHVTHNYNKSLDELRADLSYQPPSKERPYLMVATCQTSHKLHQLHLKGFFTHILLDEGAMMREPEAVAPLSLADMRTKIVIAGDKQQVGPDLLVLGEQPRGKGLSVSLLERLENHYQQVGGAAKHYLVRLVTNYRCHGEILNLAETLFYKSALKSEVPVESTHPDAPFPLIFVCSSISPPQPGENPVNDLEATVVIEQLSKFAPGWPQDRWGKNFDPSQICIMSPSRGQTNKFRDALKAMKVAEKLEQVERHPTYIMQGREFRALFLSTFEATYEDGSTRNPTKSIADPYIFNTVITRARSLVVSVGNPYLLLKMEEHMGRKYGEKGKCWSNYLKRCLDEGTLTFHTSIRILDAEKQECISQLRKAVEEHIAVKYGLDESTGTFGSDSTPLQKTNDADMECEEEYGVPEKYTGRLEQDFHIKGALGKGGFAHVYEVRSKTDGGSYALKIVKLPSKATSHKKILREVRGLRKLDQPTSHPNIVRYYGSWIDMAPTDGRSKDLPWRDIESGATMPYDETEDSGTGGLGRGDTSADTLTSPNYSSDSVVFGTCSPGIAGRNVDMTFSSTTTSTSTTVAGINTTGAPVQGTPCLLIRTELCGKTLKKWLEDHKKRRRSRLFSYFEQILNAVSYIHEKKLAHRDLKPSNIFFSLEDKKVLKVGDFGLVAGNFASGSPDLSTRSSRRSQYQVSFSGHAGTPLYMSPEQIEHSRCTEKVDIYSLGVIYFEMNYVFTTGHEKEKVVRELQRTQCKIPPRFSTSLPKETVVIQKMMTHDPHHRPSAEHILESRFFEELRNAVKEEPSHVPKM